jgi:general secretion pathway protein G
MSRIKRVPRTGCRRGSGFSLLELVAVIAIISVLLVVAVDRLWELQVDAERAAMEQVVGSLQSAVGIKLAMYWVDEDFKGIQGLAGSNPMDQLAEVPRNYLGIRRATEIAATEGAVWYFDAERRVLAYRVKNTDYFRGGFGPPPEARFVIEVLYGASPRKSGGKPEVQGVRLATVAPYHWTKAAVTPTEN